MRMSRIGQVFMAEKILVGTSGWHYDHWKGPFYPQQARSDELLDFYTRRFSTVEINNSFYHLPSRKTFSAWRDATPPAFIFAVKASRYITHMKKLKDPEKALEKFFSCADGLGSKLGPILFQLPPGGNGTPNVCVIFWLPCLKIIGTHLSCATLTGFTGKFFRCWKSTIALCVFSILPVRNRPIASPPSLPTSGSMAPRTRNMQDVIRKANCASGFVTLRNSSARARSRSSSILTMTSRDTQP